jgi:hypothetical protein
LFANAHVALALDARFHRASFFFELLFAK